MVEETDDLIDLVDLGAAARTENYEIAAYETLRRMAKALGEEDAVDSRQEPREEKEALQMSSGSQPASAPSTPTPPPSSADRGEGPSRGRGRRGHRHWLVRTT